MATTTANANLTQQVEAAIRKNAVMGSCSFDEILGDVGLVDPAEFKAALHELRDAGVVRLFEYSGAAYLAHELLDTYSWDLTGYGDSAWFARLR